MAKERPKTGEPRETHQPLKIDRLPEDVHEAIKFLRNGKGLTWEQIELRSAKPYSGKWKDDKGGFIPWDTLDLELLELFPEMRLPRVTLHRWYDLRIEQARKEVIEDGDAAQRFVEKLGELKIEGMNDAVMNAMTREVFGLIRDTGVGNRVGLIETLNNTSLVLARLQRVQLQSKKADLDSRKIKLLEEREARAIKKFDSETEKLSKKASKGEVTPADMDRLRERVFGLPPKRATAEAA